MPDFEFDSYTVLAEVKNRKLPQHYLNSKCIVNPCDTDKTASSASTATTFADIAFSPQPEERKNTSANPNISGIHIDEHIEKIKKQNLKDMPAVAAVSAVPQTGWHNFAKSSCGSVEEVAEVDSDINQWLGRVRLCVDKEEIFSLLDKFRILQWSDEQRSVMSRTYIAQIEQISKPKPQEEC